MSFLIGSDHSFYDYAGTNSFGELYYIPINFAASKSIFTFFKACDGTRDTPYYPQAIQSARGARKLAAPYTWCHGRNWYDPRAQGEFWYSRLKNEPLIAVDFEAYMDSIPNYDDLWNASNRMFELGYNGKLILYTNWGYWLSYGTSQSIWTRLFAGIWLADPDDDPPVAPWWASASEKLRKAPAPFDNWLIHQNSWTGNPQEYGLTNNKKTVDENKTNLTIEELQSLFGGAYVPPTGGDMYLGTMLETRLGYSQPSVNSTSPGYVNINDKVEADRIENGWWHVVKVNGLSQSAMWIQEKGARQFIRLDSTTEPTTPPAGEDFPVTVTANGVQVFGATYPAGTKVVIGIN